jgi:hypothetical protein
VILSSGIKSSPSTHHGGAWGERRYSSYSFTTSALDGGEWSASRPGCALPPGERTPGTHLLELGSGLLCVPNVMAIGLILHSHKHTVINPLKPLLV